MTLNSLNVTVAEIKYGVHHKNFKEGRPILSEAKCRPMILFSRNIRYALYVDFYWGYLEGASNSMHGYLHPNCISSAVNRCYALWTCDPAVATCETVSDGQRSWSRDGSILSVSSIISIIVALIGCVPWFSAVAVILCHHREISILCVISAFERSLM